MPTMLVMYDIPSYADEKWEAGMGGAGWKKIGRTTYAKVFDRPELAISEVTAVFQTLGVELEEEDEEHVRLIYPGRDQAGNIQLGIKTLFGKKPT
jgi:hypothetical protein